MYQRPDSPLAIGGVLDDGFKLVRASFPQVIWLSLFGAVLANFANLFGGIDPEQPPALSIVVGIGLIVGGLMGVVFYAAIIAKINAVAEGEELSPKSAMRLGLRLFFPLLGCSLLYALATMLGFVALIIPGVILGLSLALGPYLVITDRMGPIEALKASHKLVWGYWWRTAAIFTVALFIVMTFYVMLGAIGGAAVALGGGSEAAFRLLTTLVAVVGSAVINPAVYAFGLVVLNDLKLRKQGDDLEERIGAIESP